MRGVRGEGGGRGALKWSTRQPGRGVRNGSGGGHTKQRRTFRRQTTERNFQARRRAEGGRGRIVPAPHA